MFLAATKSAPTQYPNASLTQVGSGNSTANQTTYTFTAVNFGTAASNRVIAVLVQTQATLSTVTIGGISATIVGSTACYVAYANVPTGTSGTIVVTHTASTSRCYVDCYAVYPGRSTTPSATATQDVAGASKTIDVVKGGVAVFLSTNTANNTAITTTWSGSDGKNTFGSANSSANYYWRQDWFTSPFASSYSGTLTSSLSSKKAMVAWR